MIVLALPAFAQPGRITGVVKEKGCDEPVPYANILIYQEGTPVSTAVADISGAFKTRNLEPGCYDVQISSIGFTTTRVVGVVVKPERSTPISVDLPSGNTDQVELVPYKAPVSYPNANSPGPVLTVEDIQRMRTHGLNTVARRTPGVYDTDEGGGLNIRGNRNGSEATSVSRCGRRLPVKPEASLKYRHKEPAQPRGFVLLQKSQDNGRDFNPYVWVPAQMLENLADPLTSTATSAQVAGFVEGPRLIPAHLHPEFEPLQRP